MIPKWNIKILIFMGTGSHYPSIETDDIYKDISVDVEKWLGTSNYD